MLSVERLAASYGPAQVLFDITFTVGAGEVVTLLGRNGMGKTTTIFALMGLVPPQSGTATFDGVSLVGLPPYRIAQAGLGLVPEGRQIFPTLTVEENLVATGAARFGTPRWTLPRIYEFFPSLAARKRNMGNELSGGEQQMLAIGRALMTNPQLLLLDEPMEGLAPIIVEELVTAMRRMCSEGGLTTIIVEQHPVLALTMSEHCIVLERGTVAHAGRSADLAADLTRLDELLGVGKHKGKSDGDDTA
jgi:branched-chain amino acid transport system ATP-binding protein